MWSQETTNWSEVFAASAAKNEDNVDMGHTATTQASTYNGSIPNWQRRIVEHVQIQKGDTRTGNQHERPTKHKT